MDENAFGPTVSFDCEDDIVMVVFRAVDCSNNFNDCMVEITVEDKMSPVVACPANTSIDCDVYYTDYAPALDAADWSVLEDFGVVTLIDNCSFTDTYEVTYDIDQCGEGVITRKWTATDAAGKKAYDVGLRKLDVLMKGPGSGRESALRALQNIGFIINNIKDVTPLPHNGCRPKKKRRV